MKITKEALKQIIKEEIEAVLEEAEEESEEESEEDKKEEPKRADHDKRVRAPRKLSRKKFPRRRTIKRR